MLKEARENSKEFKGKDHYFIILDRDSWTDAHFQILQEWEAKNEKNHLIVSNVSFEYWLLLHFEKGDGVNSMDQCIKTLKKYVPDYDKGVNFDIDIPMVESAAKRAKKRWKGKTLEDILTSHDSNTNMFVLLDVVKELM